MGGGGVRVVEPSPKIKAFVFRIIIINYTVRISKTLLKLNPKYAT